MDDKDKGKLLLALEEKKDETMTAIGVKTEKKSKENETWYDGYTAGINDAKEVVEEFGRPTEDVLG